VICRCADDSVRLHTSWDKASATAERSDGGTWQFDVDIEEVQLYTLPQLACNSSSMLN